MNIHDLLLTKRVVTSQKKKPEIGRGSLAPSSGVFTLLFALCIFFALFSLALRFFVYRGIDFVGLTSLINSFDVDLENSIPTWYNSQILFLCAAVLYLIFTFKRTSTERYTLHWLGLTLIFLAFSIDEIVSFHESIVGPFMRRAFNLSGILYFGWVVPAAILIVVFAIAYFRFFINLPSRTRLLFFLSALLYIGGALGVELLGGYYFDAHGPNNITYAAITTVEEVAEMIGVVLFLYALVGYLNLLNSASPNE